MSATMNSPDAMTPEDVREQFRQLIEWQADSGSERTPLQELLTPRAKLAILDALLGVNEPLSAAEICDHAEIDRSTFADHESPLMAAGVLERPKKVGNAWVYRLNQQHPVVQLLTMLDVAFRHGETPMLLDEQFVGTPGEDYQPGDHPDDPRDS